ncbi:AraC family transcriptional regulator [Chitinimonas sp.]|uniref:AraC family transcriptional regulator n=1 Tax=Chitinimonas sp. TaxID=1934313 RepID=UPI002F941DEE
MNRSSPPALATLRAHTASLVAQLAPAEGYTETALAEVRLMRANRALPRTPVLYESCICVIVQGSKLGYLAGTAYRYDAQHYLVVSVPMAFESEAQARPSEPLLGVSLRIDPTIATELALAIDAQAPAAAAPQGMLSTPMDEDFADALLRLLRALSSPLEAKLLGPAILRELYYRVLTGQQGPAMRAALTHGSHFGRIGRALRYIHANPTRTISVAELAQEASMSVPAFHAHFKRVTHNSPLQYLKTTRLHQARLLMVRQGVTAAAAAAAVGYESSSQFNREFKRLFGRTPVEEARAMQQVLALQAA